MASTRSHFDQQKSIVLIESRFVSTYVRDLILRENKTIKVIKDLESGVGFMEMECMIVVMIDIAGYSAVTSALTGLGKISSEIITTTVGMFMNKIVNVVAQHGGDIVKFLDHDPPAGNNVDPYQSGFRYSTHSNGQRKQSILSISSSSNVPTSPTSPNLDQNNLARLSVHIAIVGGDLNHVIMGIPEERLDYSICGACMSKIGDILDGTKSGELGLDVDLWKLINPSIPPIPNKKPSITTFDPTTTPPNVPFVKFSLESLDTLNSLILSLNSTPTTIPRLPQLIKVTAARLRTMCCLTMSEQPSCLILTSTKKSFSFGIVQTDVCFFKGFIQRSKQFYELRAVSDNRSSVCKGGIKQARLLTRVNRPGVDCVAGSSIFIWLWLTDPSVIKEIMPQFLLALRDGFNCLHNLGTKKDLIMCRWASHLYKAAILVIKGKPTKAIKARAHGGNALNTLMSAEEERKGPSRKELATDLQTADVIGIESRFVAGYVRDLVTDSDRCAKMLAELDRGKAYVEKDYIAVVMIDISGYSKVTSALTALGKISSEIVTNTVSSFMNKIINVVAQYGGDIVKFLGDALLITFSASPHEPNTAEGVIMRAIECCSQTLSKHGSFLVQWDTTSLQTESVHISREAAAYASSGVGVSESMGARLRLHIAITAGRVQRMIMGNPRIRLDYSVGGECLNSL
ncbi:Adenylate cyclase type 10, partial [Blyttiomyces sp. JEL0837]